MSTSIVSTVRSKEISNAMQEVEKDRYKFYRENLKNSEGIVWARDLNAWLIFDYETISKLLKDSRLKANRKGQFVDKLNTSKYNKEILSGFYSRWLMYMDNPMHSDFRKKVQLPFNLVNKEVANSSHEHLERILEGMKAQECGEIDIHADIAVPFVSGVMSELLGLTEENYLRILEESTSAVDFLWKTYPSDEEINSTIDSIEKTYYLVKSIIDEGEYKKGRLLDLILNDVDDFEEVLSLIINIAVDGHEPFVSATKAATYYYLNKLEENSDEMATFSKKEFVKEVLRLECPFPYCARTAKEEIRIGNSIIDKDDRVIFLISAGNRDHKKYSTPDSLVVREKPAKSLTFGVGSHYCVGGVLTMSSLENYVEHLSKVSLEYSLTIIDSNWKDSFGYRTLENVNVTYKKTVEKVEE